MDDNSKLVNDIQNSLKTLSKYSKMDFNCPAQLYKLYELINDKYFKDLYKCYFLYKDIPIANIPFEKQGKFIKIQKILVEKIKEILGMYKLVTKDNFFTIEEIKNNIDTFKTSFIKKKEESLLTGKKILIVIGESHEFQESMFLELLILTILKINGFNSVLLEYREDSLKKLLKNPSAHWEGLNVATFKNILNMKLAGIGPKNIKAEDALGSVRCDAINKNIAKNFQQDQMVIIGASHLKHIRDSEEINNNFIVMLLRVNFATHKAPIELVQQLSEEEEYILSEEVIRLDFASSVESFSINKLIEIYINVLPMIIGDKEFSENTIFSSDFAVNYQQCKKFNDLPQDILILNSTLGDLTSYRTDEL